MVMIFVVAAVVSRRLNVEVCSFASALLEQLMVFDNQCQRDVSPKVQLDLVTVFTKICQAIPARASP